MIWGFIISALISVVLSVVAYALQPRPKQQKQRITDQRREFDNPTSSAGRPMPVVFGTMTILGPNVLHAPNKQSIQLKKYKTNPNLVRYFRSIDYGLCQGPIDSIRRIRISDKTLWAGEAVHGEVISIHKSSFNGGMDKDGGVAGKIFFQAGTSTQKMPSEVARTLYGEGDPDDIYAYRHVARVVFKGNESHSNADFRTKGFWWGHSPVLPSVDVTVTRIPDDWYSSKAQIDSRYTESHRDEITGVRYEVGPDANPAHIIHDALTNDIFGISLPASMLDDTSFRYVADTLHNEGLGLSLLWVHESTLEDFVREVLAHIEGFLYLDPVSGLLTLKLLRGDYAAADLDTYDESNSIVRKLIRQPPAELTNVISLTYTNPITEEDESVSVQNLGGIVQAGGNSYSDSRSMGGIRSAELAFEIAEREMSLVGTALIVGEIDVSRVGSRIVPGDVIKVISEAHGLDETVMRVSRVDPGKPGDSRVRLSVTVDIFALRVPTFESAQTGIVPDAVRRFGLTRGNGEITLRFLAPSSAGGSPIVDYQYRRNGGVWTSLGNTNTSHTLSGLSNGTSYDYEVRPVNSSGPGPESPVRTMAPSSSAAAVPGQVEDLAFVPTGASFAPEWRKPGENGSTIHTYQYEFDGGTWTDFPEPLEEAGLLENLTVGDDYSLRVRAVSWTGTGAASDLLTETLLDPRTGIDGLGFETIYAVTATDSAPSNPDNAWGYDDPQPPWFDGAPAVSSSLPYLWWAQRAAPGQPAVGADIEADWSDVTLFSRFGPTGNRGAPGDPASRGSGLFHVFISAAEQTELEAAADDALPAGPLASANAITPGANLNGDFVRFYRTDPVYNDYWVWNDTANQWERASDFLGAVQIQAVNISAVKGDFQDIEVTGRLSIDHIDADVRNAQVLWEGVANTEDAVILPLTESLDGYDSLLFYGNIDQHNVPGSSSIYATGGMPVSVLRTGTRNSSKSSVGTKVNFAFGSGGTNQEQQYVWRSVGGLDLYVAEEQDEDSLALLSVVGFKNPAERPPDEPVSYAAGDILTVDRTTRRVYGYNGASWDSGLAVPLGVVDPVGVAVDPVLGDILISDSVIARVYRHNGTSWDNGFACPPGSTVPVSVAVDPVNRDILIMDLRTDRFYRHNGTSWDSGIAVASGVTNPTGMAVDPG